MPRRGAWGSLRSSNQRNQSTPGGIFAFRLTLSMAGNFRAGLRRFCWVLVAESGNFAKFLGISPAFLRGRGDERAIAVALPPCTVALIESDGSHPSPRRRARKCAHLLPLSEAAKRDSRFRGGPQNAPQPEAPKSAPACPAAVFNPKSFKPSRGGLRPPHPPRSAREKVPVRYFGANSSQHRFFTFSTFPKQGRV